MQPELLPIVFVTPLVFAVNLLRGVLSLDHLIESPTHDLVSFFQIDQRCELVFNLATAVQRQKSDLVSVVLVLTPRHQLFLLVSFVVHSYLIDIERLQLIRTLALKLCKQLLVVGKVRILHQMLLNSAVLVPEIS